MCWGERGGREVGGGEKERERERERERTLILKNLNSQGLEGGGGGGGGGGRKEKKEEKKGSLPRKWLARLQAVPDQKRYCRLIRNQSLHRKWNDKLQTFQMRSDTIKIKIIRKEPKPALKLERYGRQRDVGRWELSDTEEVSG